MMEQMHIVHIHGGADRPIEPLLTIPDKVVNHCLTFLFPVEMISVRFWSEASQIRRRIEPVKQLLQHRALARQGVLP